MLRISNIEGVDWGIVGYPRDVSKGFKKIEIMDIQGIISSGYLKRTLKQSINLKTNVEMKIQLIKIFPLK